MTFGWTLRKRSPHQLKAADLLFVEHRYAVAIPLRRGVGRSEGTYTESPDYRSLHKDLILEGKATMSDVANAVIYLRQQPFVDPTRVVVVGYSAGGWGAN